MKKNQIYYIKNFEVFSERNGNYIIIFPEVPYWIAVTQAGYSVLKKIQEGKNIEEIADELLSENNGEIIDLLEELLTPLYKSKIIYKEVPSDEEARRIPKPNKITFLQTMECNLRCRHCCVSDMPENNYENMTVENAKTALKNCLALMDEGKKKVSFLGGEPLCGNRFVELLEYAYELGYEIGLSTNGILVDETFAQLANRYHVNVQISLDGATRESHETIRGKGTWEKALKAIDLLNKYSVDINTNFVYHTGNIHEIEAYFDLVQAKKVKKVRLIPLMNMGRAVGNFKRVPLDEFIDVMILLIKKRPELIDLLDETTFMGLILNAKFSQKMTACGAGIITLTISPSGDVFPCLNLYDSQFKICNIFDSDYLKEFEESLVRKNFANINIATNNEKCSICKLKYFCGGKCRGETYQETGDIFAPYPYCDEWKRALIKIFWLLVEYPDLGERKYLHVIDNVGQYLDLWH